MLYQLSLACIPPKSLEKQKRTGESGKILDVVVILHQILTDPRQYRCNSALRYGRREVFVTLHGVYMNERMKRANSELNPIQTSLLKTPLTHYLPLPPPTNEPIHVIAMLEITAPRNFTALEATMPANFANTRDCATKAQEKEPSACTVGSSVPGDMPTPSPIDPTRDMGE